MAKFCSNCGNKVSTGDKFCENCGFEVKINLKNDKKIVNDISLIEKRDYKETDNNTFNIDEHLNKISLKKSHMNNDVDYRTKSEEYINTSKSKNNKISNFKLTKNYKYNLILGTLITLPVISGAYGSFSALVSGIAAGLGVFGYLTIIITSYDKYKKNKKRKYILGILYGILLGLSFHIVMNTNTSTQPTQTILSESCDEIAVTNKDQANSIIDGNLYRNTSNKPSSC